MINRALIRLKVVQLIYAYYQNEGKTTEVALKELDYSLQKAYDLYRMLLLLLVELHRRALQREEARQNRVRHTETASAWSGDRALAENKLLVQFEENKSLQAYADKQKNFWKDEDVLLKKLYEAWINDETFLHYLDQGDHSYEADREIVRKFYKVHIENNVEIETLLEEQNLYWNDDKEIVDSFVLKTIKRFVETNGAEQDLLPAYSNDEDREFAVQLFKATIERGEETRELISTHTKNWEYSRLAFMDTIIMQVALAEILTFDNIPLSVSFNEYLEIAKVYSTPRSSGYVHGVIDHIVKELKEQGRLFKQ